MQNRVILLFAVAVGLTVLIGLINQNFGQSILKDLEDMRGDDILINYFFKYFLLPTSHFLRSIFRSDS